MWGTVTSQQQPFGTTQFGGTGAFKNVTFSNGMSSANSGNTTGNMKKQIFSSKCHGFGSMGVAEQREPQIYNYAPNCLLFYY